MLGKLRIYLDNCSLNRPFDDQGQIKVRMETEAKQEIQRRIIADRYELIWSYVVEFENNRNPFEDKRRAIADWKEAATVHCVENDFILSKAQELERIGLKQMDALHAACAIYAKCDFLITTDKGFYNKPVREIRVLNPVAFINEMEDE